MSSVFSICLTAALGIWLQIVQAQSGRSLAVAEVLDNPAKYAGQIITVNGLLAMTLEYRALSGSGCEVRLNAQKRPFACGMLFSLPDCGSPESICGGNLAEVARRIREVSYRRNQPAVRLSLTGELVVAPKKFVEYDPPPMLPGLPRGEYVQTGFGHMNAFLAELVVVDGRVASTDRKQR